MGVLQEYGQFAPDSYETVEGGNYICDFAGVTHEMRPSFEDANVKVPQFKWTFRTADGTVDSNGDPYQFVKFTGRAYGNERANLTSLLNSMAGRPLTPQEFASLEVSQMQRTQYMVIVSLETNSKGAPVNKIQAVSRYRQPGQVNRPNPQPGAQPNPQAQRPPQASQSVRAQAEYVQPAAAFGGHAPAARPPQPNPTGGQYVNTAPAPVGSGDDFDDLTDPFAEG